MANKPAGKGTAPVRKGAQGSNLKVFYGLLIAVAVAGVGWIGYSATQRSGGTVATEPIEMPNLADTQTLLREAQGISIGPADAPPILVFSDFTCPACNQFSQYIEPRIRSEFIDKGLARFVYYDFPLGGTTQQHKWGFVAARAARCANEQNKFWEYHDILFGRQVEWSYIREVPADKLIEYAQLVGLETAAFGECLRSDRHADVVTANRHLGEQLRVGGTPTVFIGGRSVQSWGDWESVRDAIQRETGVTAGQ